MSTAKQNTAAAEPTEVAAGQIVNGRKAVTLQLETPILRGSQIIDSIQLLKPRTGDLRGLSLAEVTMMKTDAVAELLTRITLPTLLKNEVSEMDVADLINCAVEITSFFASKGDLARPSV